MAFFEQSESSIRQGEILGRDIRRYSEYRLQTLNSELTPVSFNEWREQHRPSNPALVKAPMNAMLSDAPVAERVKRSLVALMAHRLSNHIKDKAELESLMSIYGLGAGAEMKEGLF